MSVGTQMLFQMSRVKQYERSARSAGSTAGRKKNTLPLSATMKYGPEFYYARMNVICLSLPRERQLYRTRTAFHLFT
jgi:hypothetical protein